MQLAERATAQASRFGARLTVPAAARSLDVRDDGHYVVRLDDDGGDHRTDGGRGHRGVVSAS